jgi:hypothetical protein
MDEAMRSRMWAFFLALGMVRVGPTRRRGGVRAGADCSMPRAATSKPKVFRGTSYLLYVCMYVAR